MKFSIITINYNNKDGLIKTIESVMSQSNIDYEYIIIDGGSTDGSTEFITYCTSNPEYRNKITYWISEPDNGIYNAMNKGIQQSHGEYCLFLNSGDYLTSSQILESACSEINNQYADIYYGNAYMLTEKQTTLWALPKKMSFQFLYMSNICHQSAFIHRSLFDLKIYNDTYHIVSDWEWFFTMFLHGYSFQKIHTILVYYDTQGISSIQQNAMKNERKNILNSLLPLAVQNDLDAYYELQKNPWFKYIIFFKKHRTINAVVLTLLKIFNKILSLFT